MPNLKPHQQVQQDVCTKLLKEVPCLPHFQTLAPKKQARLTGELHSFLQYLTINTKYCARGATQDDVDRWLMEVGKLSDFYYRHRILSMIKELLPEATWQLAASHPLLTFTYRLRDFLCWHAYENKKAKLSAPFFHAIKQHEIVEAELLCTPFYRALGDAFPHYGQVGGFTQSDEDIVQAIQRHFSHEHHQEQLTIVDIACGAGRLLKRLAREFPQAKLIGTSIFEFTAEEIAAFQESNIEAIYCEADRIDLPDESAHIVVCSEVIEHLKEPRTLVQEIDRILKPGGAFCVTAPSKASYMYTGNPISYLSVFLSPYRGRFLPAFHNLYAPLSFIKFVHYGFTPLQFYQVFAERFPQVHISTTRFTALRKFRLQSLAPKLPILKYMGGLCMAAATKPGQSQVDSNR